MCLNPNFGAAAGSIVILPMYFRAVGWKPSGAGTTDEERCMIDMLQR